MEQPKKYIKKPVSIQAMKWTGENLRAIITFIEGKVPSFERNQNTAMDRWEDYKRQVARAGLTIETLEGDMKADIGDYIVRGLVGEFYPCKPDIFTATYYTQDEYSAL